MRQRELSQAVPESAAHIGIVGYAVQVEIVNLRAEGFADPASCAREPLSSNYL